MNIASESLPTIKSWRSAAEAVALKYIFMVYKKTYIYIYRERGREREIILNLYTCTHIRFANSLATPAQNSKVDLSNKFLILGVLQ